MLALKNRLKKQKDFQNVFRHGRSAQENGLFLKIKIAEKPYSRFGFIVSGKVFKKAVLRNKIRRQLHEAAHKLLPEMKTAVDAVFIVRPGFDKRDFADIEMTVRAILRKLRII